MYKLFELYSKIFVKSIFKVFSNFLFMLVLFTSFIGKFNSSMMLLVSIVLFVISSYIIKRMQMSRVTIWKMIVFVLVIGAFISGITSIYFYIGYNVHVIILMSLYFFVIWISGMKMLLEEETHSRDLSRFIVTLVILWFVVSNFEIMTVDFSINSYSQYLSIYCFVAIINLARISIDDAYEERHDKTVINRSRNIVRSNILFTILVLALGIILAVDLINVSSLLEIIPYLVLIGFVLVAGIMMLLLYPVFLVLSKIINLLLPGVSLDNLIFSDRLKGFLSKISDLLWSLAQKNKELVKNVITKDYTWLFYVGIFLILVIYLFVKLKKIYGFTPPDSEYSVKKEFTLSKKEVFKGIKDMARKTLYKIRNLFQKDKSQYHSKHIVRKIYIDCVKKLNKNGKEFKIFFTPNEYLHFINDEEAESVNIRKLTRCYNKLRYGNKDITGEELEEILDEKNQIDL